jgi:preprotein translocase subunit SecG
MKTFIVACLIAAVIAIGGVMMLNSIQEPVSEAFSTSAVRI